MEHFYQNIQGWFTYPSLYKFIVNSAPSSAHFVEVGCWKGTSAAFMAVEIFNSGKKIKFDCIDTWKGSEENNLTTIQQQEELYLSFIKNIEPVSSFITAYRTYSIEGSKLYKDNSLDFVFIDAAHDYNSVTADIKAWFPKVKKNGFIAGHDYYENPAMLQDVKNAVNDFFKEQPYTFFPDQFCWLYKKE